MGGDTQPKWFKPDLLEHFVAQNNAIGIFFSKSKQFVSHQILQKMCTFSTDTKTEKARMQPQNYRYKSQL